MKKVCKLTRHPERGSRCPLRGPSLVRFASSPTSRCKCDSADEALIRNTMTLVSESFPLVSLCSRSQRRLSAFTLAEVLITLAIIGVVAALTIPTVIRNYQKQQTVVQLKKKYSALANTTNLAVAEHGPVEGWEIGENASGQAAVDFANKYLIPYLKVSKNCENKITNDCAFNYSYLSDNVQHSFGNTYARFYLNDGTLIGVWIENTVRADGFNYRQARIYIDLNGQKKPNKLGRDVFHIKYYIFTATQSNTSNGKFMPYCYSCSRDQIVGKTGDPEACSRENRGFACATLIFRDGWKISDDYPW